jgi:hypothetical protein
MGEQVHASYDFEGCPGQAKCVRNAYLINGDKVLAAHPADGWVCIYHWGKRSDYTGWVPQRNLRVIAFPQNPELRDWLGSWESVAGVDKVTIRLAPKGMLKISGKAYWQGGKNTYGEEIVHLGGVRGVTAPIANKLTVREGDGPYGCVVNFELIGTYLVGSDNSICGGMNVRFNGVYRRKPYESGAHGDR